MSEYKRLGISCTHCGAELAGKWGKVRGGFTIQGAYPIDFVHAASGKSTCTRTYEAEAYSIWSANKALEQAERSDDAPPDDDPSPICHCGRARCDCNARAQIAREMRRG